MSNISDTWGHTLNQKGTMHSYDEMMRMFAPGNRVNSWIDDCVYLIDHSVLNSADPIIKELLTLGEPDFGCPTKDILFEGSCYSSNFIHTVIQAAPIIKRLQQKKISNPRILEIGGGVGLLQYLLIGYFNGKLTYYSCDIPETLFIQEWFIRNCFPRVSTFFAGGAALANDYSESGVHFINAYVLKKLSFAFDCAVNIDSMQEMYASTVCDYIRFIEENISKSGFFFFQNHYGHSAHGVCEASEYELGSHWHIHSIEYSPQILNCDESEQLRVIYDQTEQNCAPVKRCRALRLMWTGFVSNHIQNGSREIDILIDFANSRDAISWEETAEMLLNCNESFYHALEPGSNLPVPIKIPFWRSYAKIRPFYHATVPSYQYLDHWVRFVQGNLLELLGSMMELDEKAIYSRREEIRDDLKKAIINFPLSDYWTAYFAGIFFALGDSSCAISLLDPVIVKKSSPHWRIRLAQLCSRFNDRVKSVEILKNIEVESRLDFYNNLQICELAFFHGERQTAWDLLEKLFSETVGDSSKIYSFTRISGLLDRYDLAKEGIKLIAENEGISNMVLSLVRSFPNKADGTEFYHELVKQNIVKTSLHTKILRFFLESNPEERGVVRGLIENDRSADYYDLASVGKLLLQEGMPEEADFCFLKSISLRPNAYLHLEFIGNAYFATEAYDQAAKYLRQVIENKVYWRHVWAKYLYSCLPKKYQNNNLSFAANDIEILFQRKQDFYHSRGPSSK